MMKNTKLIGAVVLFFSIVLMSCAKTYINTTRSRLANYWVLDSKEYHHYDAYSGAYLGSETVVFQGDSHYDFSRNNYYDGVEIEGNVATRVGGRYTIVNSNTIIMDYDGYNNQEVKIDQLNSSRMQLSVRYEQDGESVDETLYFYR